MGRNLLKTMMNMVVFGMWMAFFTSILAGPGQVMVLKAASERPRLMKGRLYLNERAGDDSALLLEGFHETLWLTEESAADYADLEQALKTFRNKEENNVRKMAGEYVKERKEYPENAYDEKVPYVIQNQCYVRRADEAVVSFIYKDYSYEGGVHGGYVITSGNYDAKTGKALRLEDIVKDKDGLIDALKAELEKKYEEGTFFEEMPETLASEVNGEDGLELTWVLDPQGVTFCFSPYEIGPYAAGTQYVTLPYDAYDNLFTDRFRPEKAAACGLEFPDDEILDLDVDQDGRPDRISVNCDYDEQGESITNYTVCVNDEEAESSDSQTGAPYFRMDSLVLLSDDGKAYLYLCGIGDSDYNTIDIYDLSSGKPVYVDSCDFARASFPAAGEDYDRCSAVLTDPDRMPLSARFDILSTYDGSKLFRLGQDGKPESLEPYYMIDGEIQLKSRKDIRLDQVDEKGNVTKKDVTVPSGSTFDLYRTDGKKILDARLKDGSLVRFIVEGTYPARIDGVDAEELFEKLYYAG